METLRSEAGALRSDVNARLGRLEASVTGLHATIIELQHARAS